MALIKCPECGREVSDKAKKCPGCAVILLNESKMDDNSGVDEIEEKQIEQQAIETINNSKKKTIIIASVSALIVLVIVIVILATRNLGNSTSNISNDAKTSNSNNTEVDAAGNADLQPEQKEESDSTSASAEANANTTTEIPTIAVSAAWEEGQPSTQVGNDESNAKILETNIVNSSFGMLLVMDFEYTNNSEDAKDFINDRNCAITPYQNGVALAPPDYTSEPGKFDCSQAYTSIKKGGIINTQLAWVLKDTLNPIEIDFGYDENYKPVFSATLNLSGGANNKQVSSEEKAVEEVESNYNISWDNDQAPEAVGQEDSSIAKIKNASIVESGQFGTLLVIDFEYTNNGEDSKNFINDMNCTVTPYQNGIALEHPGFTSESGKFDSSESYTLVKKGGKINTQLVWILQDVDNPVEIDFGYNEEYKPEFIKTLTISPK